MNTWRSSDGNNVLLRTDCVPYIYSRLLYTNGGGHFDLVYADMLYDDFNFDRWLPACRELLADTGSIFVQTDYRSVAELKLFMDSLFGKDKFVNWIVWPYDWGGRPKNAFGRKHDDILWYAKTSDYIFYPENVQIPKKTAGTSLNPSGRNTKTPTDVWTDVGNFHTMSSERVSGTKWQKPERLVRRIVEAVTERGGKVFDPFVGSGTTIAVSMKTDRMSVGCEIDEEIFKNAKERLEKLDKVLANIG